MDYGIRNDKPYRHVSKNGSLFESDRCDFQNGVTVTKPEGITEERFMVDVSEFIGFHATVIHPELNGFQGYGCITYRIKVVKDE